MRILSKVRLMNKLIRFRVKLGATLGAINLGTRPNDPVLAFTAAPTGPR